MKLKMIQVEQDVHTTAKLQALKQNLSLKDYIRMLVEKDYRDTTRRGD